jgi:preprotein translocase subunit SecB
VADDLASTPGTLQDVFLAKVAFERKFAFQFPDKGLAYTIETGTSTEFISDDRRSVRADLVAKVTWQYPNETEEIDGPFDLILTIGSVFAWQYPETSDEDILGWVEFNAQHLLWPYLRSYVSMISGASGAPPLTIYTIQAPSPTIGESRSVAHEAPTNTPMG